MRIKLNKEESARFVKALTDEPREPTPTMKRAIKDYGKYTKEMKEKACTDDNPSS